MPLETKKVLWIALSIMILILVATGIGMILFIPKAGSSAAPASIAGTSPPRAASPDTYVRSFEPAPVPAPGQEAPPAGDSVIIIYGDKPAPETVPAASAGAAQPAAAPTATKPYSPATAAPATAAPATPAPKPVASAAPKPAVKTVLEYWIQAGSFTGRARAEDLQRDLAAKGLSSVITVKDIDGVTYFPVRVGPYLAKTEAEGWLGKVKSLPGCSEAYISQQAATR